MNDPDAGVYVYSFFVTLSFLVVLFFVWNETTSDFKIMNNKKILINNAVYRCEKLQELDLK